MLPTTEIGEIVTLAYKILVPSVSAFQILISLRLLMRILPINDGAAKKLLVIWAILLITGATSNLIVIAIREVLFLNQVASRLASDILMFTQLILLLFAYRCIQLTDTIKENENDV